MKTILSVFLIFCSVLVFGQTNHNHEHETTKENILNSYFATLSKNEYGIDNATWNSYVHKTYLLLEETAVDRASFLNYVFLTGDGNFNDVSYFLEYYKTEFSKEESELVYKVGKGEITSVNVKKYFTALQPKWMNELKAFNLQREDIINNINKLRGPSNPNPTPRACGSPCTNPGFEAGMGFWDYSTGTASSGVLLPTAIVPGLNATKPQHFIKSLGGYDMVAGGTTLPQVSPTGGNFSMMLGDSTQVIYGAAIASISFDVTPASQSFNFSYALVLQDAAGHSANDRPYFRVRMYDQGNNLIQCGEFEVIAQPPYNGFTQAPSPYTTYYYKPWVNNSISLAGYLGQCIKLEFITKDCGLGGHAGYAYIDADCSPNAANTYNVSTCNFPYNLSAPGGYVSYAWTNLAGGTTGIVGSDTLQTIQVSQPGTYQCVIVTAAGPTCVVLATYIVTGGGAPTAAYTNTTVCVGNATQFTNTSTPSGSNPITNWYWDFNGDGIIDDSTQNPSYSYPAAGQYQATLIVSSNGCNDTITQTVTVHPVANINAGPDQTICETGTVTLAAIFGGAATAGTWSGGTGAYNPANTSANAVYTPSAAEIAAGQVTLTFTTNAPSGPCVTNVDQMTIFIQHLPTANAGAPQSICEGNSVTLNGSIGGGATAATWSGGTGTFTPNNTALNATYTPTAAEFAAGTVTLTLTTNNPGGLCPPATSTVTLNLYPNPIVNFTVDIPKGCPIHCVQFTDQSTVIGNNTITAWSWTLGDGTTSNVQNPAHCYSNTGFYDVSLTVTTNNGCTGTLTIPQMIEVFAIPKADFTPTPNPASSFNPTVYFINQSSADVTYWNWNFGDGNTHPDNVTPNPSHIYPGIMDTSYMITLIVENADGCRDTTQKPIIVGPEFTFYIPNAFTPNGDGTNDGFNGTGVGIAEYDIWIFDRWGDMIWHSDKYAPFDYWDGRANQGAEVAQQDVYVWKVKLKDIFGKYHKYIGTVTLVK